MKKKMTVDFDHEAGYAIVKCDWAETFNATNWEYWVDKAKAIIGVGCLSGIIYDNYEQVSPTTVALRFEINQSTSKGESNEV